MEDKKMKDPNTSGVVGGVVFVVIVVILMAVASHFAG